MGKSDRYDVIRVGCENHVVVERYSEQQTRWIITASPNAKLNPICLDGLGPDNTLSVYSVSTNALSRAQLKLIRAFKSGDHEITKRIKQARLMPFFTYLEEAWNPYDVVAAFNYVAKEIPSIEVKGGYAYIGGFRVHRLITHWVLGNSISSIPGASDCLIATHHMDGVKLNNSPTNLAILSMSRHKEFHDRYGYSPEDLGKKDWQKVLRDEYGAFLLGDVWSRPELDEYRSEMQDVVELLTDRGFQSAS